MKAKIKSEWFELDKPIGEPKLVEDYNEDTYWIERIVNNEGETIWFGQSVNWKKEQGKNWTVLGVDETVEMVPEYKDDKGEWQGGYYPEGRNIWIDCELPIYEKLYRELQN